MPSTKLKTVRIMIRRRDGRYLCVIDNDNPTRIGLPGGRIEPNEFIEDAATRELWEETGLIANSLLLIDTSNFCENQVSLFVGSHIEGSLKSSIEGRVAWCSTKDLVTGFFGDYYFNVFKKLGYL